VASLGAADRAAVKVEEAAAEVAEAVADRGEPSRLILRPSSKTASPLARSGAHSVLPSPHQDHPQTATPGAGPLISPRLLRPQRCWPVAAALVEIFGVDTSIY